jgi:hypothetical protein
MRTRLLSRVQSWLSERCLVPARQTSAKQLSHSLVFVPRQTVLQVVTIVSCNAESHMTLNEQPWTFSLNVYVFISI